MTVPCIFAALPSDGLQWLCPWILSCLTGVVFLPLFPPLLYQAPRYSQRPHNHALPQHNWSQIGSMLRLWEHHCQLVLLSLCSCYSPPQPQSLLVAVHLLAANSTHYAQIIQQTPSSQLTGQEQKHLWMRRQNRALW